MAPGFGLPHAEAGSWKAEEIRGATLYVNLGPCSHRKNAPAPRSLRKGIAQVVAGMVDPDGGVQGRGLEFLREKGSPYQTGVPKAGMPVDQPGLYQTEYPRKTLGDRQGSTEPRRGHGPRERREQMDNRPLGPGDGPPAAE
ncbi:hypothetical protein MASR2M79_14390 [Aminivibrio sp.]